MYLGAILVLPDGWESHPNARYPLAIFHGHFQRDVFPWRETPPDPRLPPADLSGLARYCPNGHEGELCTKYGSDNVFLNDAVYLAEEFLKSASNPPADATVDYGLRDEHCWSGDHAHINAISRLTYSNRFIPALAAHWQRTAPRGADTKSWRY